MQLIHCYSTADQTAGERRQTIAAASQVLEKHLGEDYALFYEPLTSRPAAQPAKGILYFLVGTPGQELTPSRRAALAEDLQAAIPLPQEILFQPYPLDAIAEGGQLLADIS